MTDDELARARALIEASELGAMGRVEEVGDRLSMFAALFDRPEMINEMLPRYLAVTADRIQAVARDIFRADNRVVLTYVPEAADSSRRGGGMTPDEGEHGFQTDQAGARRRKRRS